MRTFLYFLLLFLLSIACKQGNNLNYIPEYKFNSEAWIQVNAENIKDTLSLNARTHTILPSGMMWAKKKIEATESGTYFLNVEIDRPVDGELAINDSIFKCFLIPDDTTIVNLTYKNNKPHLSFEGNTTSFNNYYQAKLKDLGYRSSNSQINAFRAGKVDMGLFKEKVLALQANEISFLEEYVKENHLPSWFIEYETANMQYLSAFWLLLLPEYNIANNLPSTPLPNNYYSFLEQVKIDNSKAIFSSVYFSFLDYYFLKGEDRKPLEKVSGYHWTSLYNSLLLPKVEKELSGKAREIYQYHLLTNLIKKLPSTYPLDSLLSAYNIQDTSLVGYAKHLYQSSSRESVNKKLLKGDLAPNFFVVDSEEKLHELRQYKDKVVYLNFYASWCKPCIKSIPSKNRLYERMKNEKGFILINVCLDSKIDEWKELIKIHNMQGLNVYADGNWDKKIKDSYGIQGIPQYVLLNKDNILIENYTQGAEKIEEMIKELL